MAFCTYAFSAKCADKTRGDGLCTPATKCVHCINTHLRIPHLFGIQETGNFARKLLTFPEARRHFQESEKIWRQASYANSVEAYQIDCLNGGSLSHSRARTQDAIHHPAFYFLQEINQVCLSLHGNRDHPVPCTELFN